MDMSKRITLNEDARSGLLRGMKLAAQTLAVTIGPKGRNVVIGEPGKTAIINDGYSIIKEIVLEDPLENAGARLLREASMATNNTSGDGTTTTAILTLAMVEEGFRLIASGYNPVLLRQGLQKAFTVAKENIDWYSQDVATYEDVKRVATIASGYDPELGTLIADAVDKIGKDGVITVEDGHSTSCSLTIQEGVELPGGAINPAFIPDGHSVSYDRPRVLVTDYNLINIGDMIGLLDELVEAGETLLIVANDVSGSALTAFLQNLQLGNFTSVAIKPPEIGDRRLSMMEDIAILTGTTVFRAHLGHSLKDITRDQLGYAKHVTVKPNATILTAEDRYQAATLDRIKWLRKEVHNYDSTFEREKIQARLAQLSGGVAVITLGAVTETELRDRKLRAEDALSATKSAIEGGVVAGGGSTLWKASRLLGDDIKAGLFDSEAPEVRMGAEVLVQAMQRPLWQIIHNAGENPERVIGRMEDRIDPEEDETAGYNAMTGEIEDLVSAGVIDSTKGMVNALYNASSTAGMLFTGEAVINFIAEPEEAPTY
jgi:chaperonin GroEL